MSAATTPTTNPLDDPVLAASQMAGVDPTVARALLREDWQAVDPLMPSLIAEVTRRGGAECWHKHSTFLQHLLGTYRIAVLWGLPREVALCALLHSAFSNSFVNLALFPPTGEGRAAVEKLAGADVERWTWLFCRVPRHDLIYGELVDPIVYGIRSGGGGGGGGDDDEEEEKNKEQEGGGAAAAAAAPLPTTPPDYASQFPANVTVRDIRDGSPIPLDAYELGILLALTILDFSEQWHSWQDAMMGTLDDKGGRLRYAGRRAHCLWPGQSKPGLYLHTLSEMGRLVVAANAKLERLGDPRRVPLPKVWRSCSEVVSREAQLKGRDLYWRAVAASEEEVCGAGASDFADRSKEDFWDREEEQEETDEKKRARWQQGEAREREAEACLRESAALLPCAAEPRVVLSQLLLQRAVRLGGAGDHGGARTTTTTTETIDQCWREAGQLALEGLSLLLASGTPWDKRFPWGAWCAWARVCCKAARDRDWPRNDEPLRVINLGLVR
jgi:hypothetical protein